MAEAYINGLAEENFALHYLATGKGKIDPSDLKKVLFFMPLTVRPRQGGN